MAVMVLITLTLTLVACCIGFAVQISELKSDNSQLLQTLNTLSDRLDSCEMNVEIVNNSVAVLLHQLLEGNETQSDPLQVLMGWRAVYMK